MMDDAERSGQIEKRDLGFAELNCDNVVTTEAVHGVMRVETQLDGRRRECKKK